VALRASDLLSLRFDQIEHGQKKVAIIEKKTKKAKEIPITPVVRQAVARLREYYSSKRFYRSKEFNPVYLFQSTSRRAYHLCQPICIQYLSYAYKEASRTLGFDFNVNTHSMRKTFGYHAYEGGADIHYLQALFNHSNSHVTLRYIGVTKSTINQMYFDNAMDIA
jgi:integrase